MDKTVLYIKGLHGFQMLSPQLHFVLFGFRPDPASHPGRPGLNHSYCYAFSPALPACFTGSTLNSESFMQYAG